MVDRQDFINAEGNQMTDDEIMEYLDNALYEQRNTACDLQEELDELKKDFEQKQSIIASNSSTIKSLVDENTDLKERLEKAEKDRDLYLKWLGEEQQKSKQLQDTLTALHTVTEAMYKVL